MSNVPHEQLVYARWIERWTRVAFVLLSVTFLAYVLGAGQPLVAFDRLPALWHLPAQRFVAESGAPAGWAWLGRLGQTDYLNLAGIALLATGTLVAYTRLLLLAGRLELRFTVLVALQVAVLALAASGFAASH